MSTELFRDLDEGLDRSNEQVITNSNAIDLRTWRI